MRHIVCVVVLVGLLYAPVYAQTETREFPPLTSSAEFAGPHGKITLKIRSEAVFAGHLVSDLLWTQMPDEEKKTGHASVYYYTYTFTNAGSIKLRFTIANYDVLRSPLFQFAQDFSIVLEPGQTKIVKFQATTTPHVADAPCLIMGLHSEKNKWWFLAGWTPALYIPQRNPIAQEMP